MTPDAFERLGALFDALVDAPPDVRAARLSALEAEDPALAARLREMLAVEDTGHPLLDGGASALVEGQALGRSVGPYRLVERLGRGGMGEVFVAERVDGQFDRRVALKIQRQGLDSESARGRFLAERQILADLTHPNIAQLLDGGLLEDGRPWFAMEYVRGRTLSAWLTEGPSLQSRLDLMVAVCDAVHFAHARLIVHRDLKPANILIDHDGAPKLVDFGIAKVLAPDGPGWGETRAGDRLMTPSWAAPEQMRGAGITTATDVHALGMVLYLLLSGEHVHGEPATLAELEAVVCTRTPPPPSEVLRVGTTESTWRRTIRGDLDTICMKALRKEPGRRYQTAAALADDIRRYRRGLPVEAQPDTLWYRARKFVRRHRLSLSVTLIVGLGFATVVGAFTLRLRAERDRAQAESAKARATAGVLRDMFEGVDPAFARGRELTAASLLERGLAQAEGLTDQPGVQAELLGVIGRAYAAIGKHRTAVDTHRRVLALRGDSDPVLEVAARLDLARALRLDAAPLAALVEARAAEVACRAWPDRTLWGRAQFELGAIALAQARIDDARAAFHAALTVAPSPEEEAAIWDGLALAAYENDELEQAERHYRRALKLYRASVGRVHPRTAATLNDLAATLRHQGRLAEAGALYTQALELGRQLFEGDHPDVALTLNHLGRLAFKQGRFSDADPLLREALRMRQAIYPDSHPMVSASQMSLAANLWRQGRLAEAEAGFRAALAALIISSGADHPYIGGARKSLGRVLVDQGKLAEAESELRAAVAIVDTAFPTGHRKRAHPRVILGEALMGLGRHVEAEEVLREGLAIRLEAHGAAHPDTARAQSVLGACLAAQGRHDEARSLLTMAVTTLRATLPAEHPDIAATKARLEAIATRP